MASSGLAPTLPCLSHTEDTRTVYRIPGGISWEQSGGGESSSSCCCPCFFRCSPGFSWLSELQGPLQKPWTTLPPALREQTLSSRQWGQAARSLNRCPKFRRSLFPLQMGASPLSSESKKREFCNPWTLAIKSRQSWYKWCWRGDADKLREKCG